MTSHPTAETFIVLEPPRFEHSRPLLIAGLRQRYSPESCDEIPALWERLAPHLGRIPRRVDPTAYGVCFNSVAPDGSYDYLAGVEVSDVSARAGDWARVRLPAQRYAVFRHREHVSTLKDTVGAILGKWLPESGQELVNSAPEAPNFLERYTEDFNPHTGMGGMEVWLPVKAVE